MEQPLSEDEDFIRLLTLLKLQVKNQVGTKVFEVETICQKVPCWPEEFTELIKLYITLCGGQEVELNSKEDRVRIYGRRRSILNIENL